MIIIPKGAIIALVIIMKRKILVGLLTAVIFLACALVINITPKVEKGSVVLTCDGSKYELPGTEKTRYCNGKSESLSAEKSFEDLLSFTFYLTINIVSHTEPIVNRKYLFRYTIIRRR